MHPSHDDYVPFSNMEAITYDLVAEYMVTKKKPDDRWMSRGTYDSIRSSIVHLIKKSPLQEPPQSFRTKMNTFMKGFARTIVDQRVADGQTLEEGKSKHFLLSKCGEKEKLSSPKCSFIR